MFEIPRSTIQYKKCKCFFLYCFMISDCDYDYLPHIWHTYALNVLSTYNITITDLVLVPFWPLFGILYLLLLQERPSVWAIPWADQLRGWARTQVFIVKSSKIPNHYMRGLVLPKLLVQLWICTSLWYIKVHFAKTKCLPIYFLK